MKFMISFRGTPDKFKEAVDHYKATYTNKPEGFNIDGFWHTINGGFILAVGDFAAIYKYAASWSHLFTFDIEPVLDDKEAAGALSEY